MTAANWVDTLLITNLPAIAQVILLLLVWLLLWLPLAIPIALVVKWHLFQPLTPQQKLPLLASLYAIAPLIVWGMAALTGHTGSDYGWQFPHLWTSLLVGWGIGVMGLVILFGMQLMAGWKTWRSPPVIKVFDVLLPLILGLWVSATEEVMFRGVLQTHLQQDYSPWIAAAIASLIFALLHLMWEPWQETVPQLPGLWLMGMVLVLARWVDGGQLGLACGLHAGWIWGIACLDSLQILQDTPKTAAWLTGLHQKPLAGVLGILFLLGTATCLWGVAH